MSYGGNPNGAPQMPYSPYSYSQPGQQFAPPGPPGASQQHDPHELHLYSSASPASAPPGSYGAPQQYPAYHQSQYNPGPGAFQAPQQSASYQQQQYTQPQHQYPGQAPIHSSSYLSAPPTGVTQSPPPYSQQGYSPAPPVPAAVELPAAPAGLLAYLLVHPTDFTTQKFATTTHKHNGMPVFAPVELLPRGATQSPHSNAPGPYIDPKAYILVPATLPQHFVDLQTKLFIHNGRPVYGSLDPKVAEPKPKELAKIQKPMPVAPHKPVVYFHAITCGQMIQFGRDIIDPLLSEKGHQQIVHLKKEFHDVNKINFVLCSPLRDAMESAAIIFGDVLQSDDRPVSAALYPGIRSSGFQYDPDSKGARSSVKHPNSACTGAKEKVFDSRGLKCSRDLLYKKWETDGAQIHQGEQRVAIVRMELHALTDVLLHGGVWNSKINFKSRTDNEDVHVALVSNRNLFEQLTPLEGTDEWDYGEFRTYQFAPASALAQNTALKKFNLYETQASKARKQVKPELSGREYCVNNAPHNIAESKGWRRDKRERVSGT